MKRILLLGGTGAMGSHLSAILADQGYDVSITTRWQRSDDQRFHYIKGDAHDMDFVRSILRHKWDAIVDFMVYSTSEFGKRVDLMLENTAQYIFISSARVFAGESGLITETSPRLLDVSTDKKYLETDEYALTKARQEDLLRRSGRMNWTIVRPYITFSETRLQLGVSEKENWLYPALYGRSIVFSRDIASCYTTLTYGKDVAYGIAGLIGNPAAIGEDFNITTDETHTWQEILDIYLVRLAKWKKGRPPVKYSEQAVNLRFRRAMYQVKYCRLFDRKFDNSKILSVVPSLKFGDTAERLDSCLEAFLARWKGNEPIYWSSQGLNDRVSGDRTSFKEIHGTKHRLVYAIYRYAPWWVLKIKG